MGSSGKYYYDEHNLSHEEVRSSSTSSKLSYDVAPEALKSVFAEMIENKPDPSEKWLALKDVDLTGPTTIHNMASDEDMAILQESFDSVTRVTSAIRKADG